MREAVIVGGGIAGLVCALSLRNAGFRAQILERNTIDGPGGLGIQLSPNATRLLASVGLSDSLREISCEADCLVVRQWKNGGAIARFPLGDSIRNRYGAPYYQIMRQDLIRVLLESINANEEITVHETTEVHGVHTTADQAVIDTTHGQLETDLVIGADGTHSTIRTKLFGSGFAVHSGSTAWRAVVKRDSLPNTRQRNLEMGLWVGPGMHLVHYPVGNGSQINIVAVADIGKHCDTNWRSKGNKEELLALYSEWNDDLLNLLQGISEDRLYRWALYRQNRLPAWSKERGVLVGDACHTTLPFLAQGAALAIEDAVVLARCFENCADVHEALSVYRSKRDSRTRKIAERSRQLKFVYHASRPLASIRNLIMPLAIGEVNDWIYRYDAHTA